MFIIVLNIVHIDFIYWYKKSPEFMAKKTTHIALKVISPVY